MLQIVNNIGIKYWFSLYQPIKDVKLKMDVNLNVVSVMSLNVCCSLAGEKSCICHLVSVIGNSCVCAAFPECQVAAALCNFANPFPGVGFGEMTGLQSTPRRNRSKENSKGGEKKTCEGSEIEQPRN